LLTVLAKVLNHLRKKWKLYLAIFFYTVIFSTITILRHRTFLTSGFDLGIFDQAFWTTVFEHKLFYSTGDLSFNPSGSFFGVHFSPLLFLILPLYAIFPSVETLLVIQTVVLALGSLPIYLISREKLGESSAVIISILYLSYPPLHYVNLSDFHLEAFLPLFFLFTVYYLEHEKWSYFLLFMLLSMITIEFTQIIMIFIAIYGLLLYRRGCFTHSRRALNYIILTVLISILLFILALLTKELFNPYTSGIPSPFHHILIDPGSTVTMVLNDFDIKLSYLIIFLAPLAFIPLLVLEPLVMVLPWIAAAFITNYPPYYMIHFHYNAFVIPFIFIAFIKAVEYISQKTSSIDARRVRKTLFVAFLCTIILSVYLNAKLPGSPNTHWNYQLPIFTEQSSIYHKVLSLIPPNASILTQNTIFPHISGRSEAYMYIPETTKILVDYILVDINSFWYSWEQPKQFGERPPLSTTVPRLLENDDYGIIASIKGLLLLKRNYTGETTIFEGNRIFYNYQNLSIEQGDLVRDIASQSKDVLYHGSDDQKGLFWKGSCSFLPPGFYNIIHAVKIGSEVDPNDNLLILEVTTSASNITQKHLLGSQISHIGQWFNITMTFELKNIASQIEFKGIANSVHPIYLDYIKIKQVSPKF
jgi:uncharacterized membrane protein